MKSDLHDIEVIYQHQTDRAVCVRAHEGDDDICIPLSQCEIEASKALFEGAALQRGCVAILTAPERVLTEKGLV